MAAPDTLDCIYVAASAKDARLTRICIASIRRFYPDITVRLLAGGPLETGLADEVAAYWQVGMADIPTGDWGWGFVKLLPLFGRPGERFMVLDSDTALTGPILSQGPDASADFVVDDEQQTEEETRRLYYDWRKLVEIDREARKPAFVFNSGQWFGTAGILTRDDFAPLVDWSTMPPRLRWPDRFMPGDQGVLNYVLNQQAALQGLKVKPRKIMHWPGHGMTGYSASAIRAGAAPARVIHWAGMKRARLGAMVGADILRDLEATYYRRIPGGRRLRWRRALAYALTPTLAAVRRRLGVG